MTDLNIDSLDGVGAIATLGARAAQPINAHFAHSPQQYIVDDGDGGKTVLHLDALPNHPDRTAATRTVSNDASFIEYVNRHGDEQTEVWADAAGNTIVGIIDANRAVGSAERYGWERHQVALKLEHTPAWKAWVAGQGLRNQAQFAEHIEEYAEHVYVPTGGELLEIAQTLQGTRNADFHAGSRLSTGQSQFKYMEEIKGSAGKSGELTIPEQFELGLAPYIGGAAYRVIAKLRWRLEGQSIQIGYKLIGIDRILEEAFKEIVDTVREGTEFPVFLGRP